MKNNLLITVLQALRVPHTAGFAEELFESHPYRHSLLGLSLLLRAYGVENVGMQLDDKSQLTRLQTPFVAQVADGLAVVTETGPRGVRYRLDGKDMHMPEDRFRETWTGVVLLLQPDAGSGEPDYARHRGSHRTERTLAALLAVCAGIVLAAGTAMGNAPFGALRLSALLAAALGTGVGVLLCLRQMRVAADAVDRLCSIFHKGGCNDVLDSPAARMPGGVSWTEAGTGYFLVQLLALLLAPDLLPAIAVAALAALPYTLWSLWYQRWRAHSWCPLCLCVLFVLWLQAGMFLAFGVYTAGLFRPQLLPELAVFGAACLAATLALHFLLPVRGRLRRAGTWRYAYRRIKLRREVFDALLAAQETLPDPTEASSVVFGPDDAPYTVTVLTNPYCNPCAAIHAGLHRLVAAGLRLRYVFTSFGPDFDPVSRLMIAAYRQLGPERALKVYDEWYAGGRARGEKFFAAHGIQPDDPQAEEEYARHRAWQEAARRYATPTILVNGHTLPPEYDVAELARIV